MMGGPYAGNAGVFLVDVIFGLYLLALMLRFLLQTVRADFYNPVVQTLVKITNPPLVPLRRWIPGFWGVDMAAVLLMLVIQLIALWVKVNIVGTDPGMATLLVTSVAELLDLLLSVYFWAILIQAVLSWVNPDAGVHPVGRLLMQLTAPVLRPVQRIMPDTGGIDFSPLVVLVLIQLLRILLISPLRDMGMSLATGL